MKYDEYKVKNAPLVDGSFYDNRESQFSLTPLQMFQSAEECRIYLCGWFRTEIKLYWNKYTTDIMIIKKDDESYVFDYCVILKNGYYLFCSKQKKNNYEKADSNGLSSKSYYR